MADSNVGRLIYKITGDLSDIKKSLKNAESQINKFTKFVKSAAGLFGAAAAFKMLSNVIKDLVNSALDEERAELRLASAMKISGQTAAGQTKQLLGLAQALSMTTTWTHEETQDAMVTLTQIGRVSARGMRELIPLVQDMATGMGTDLNTAATAVGKAMAGSAGGLKRMGIQIKETSDPTERFSRIVAALTERFGGMSEAMAKSAGGGLKQITMQFDELKEAVGTRLLQAFKGTISALASRIKADVVLSMKLSDIGSPEEAIAFLKTLRVEAARTNEEIKNLQPKGGISFGPGPANIGGALAAARKRAADLQNYMEGLNRTIRKLRAAEADMPPVIMNATQAAEAQAVAVKSLNDALSKEIDLNSERTSNEREVKAMREAVIGAEIDANKERSDNEREAKGLREKAIFDEIDANSARIATEKAAKDAEADEDLERERKKQDLILTLRQGAFNFASDLMNGLNALNQANLNRQLDEMDVQQKAQLDNFQGTEEEKTALQAEFAKARAKLEYEAAMRSWELQLAAAIVSGAESVLRGYESLPWPFNLVSAGMNAVLSAIQIAAISANKPVAKFASGGEFTVPPGYPNDTFTAGLSTGEHVSVTPAGRGGEEIIYNLNLDGRQIAHFTQKQLDNGRILIGKRSTKR